MSMPVPQTAASAELELESQQRAAMLEHLLKVGTALSGAKDLDVLLRLILSTSRDITRSDAGSVFLLDRSDPDNPRLLFKVTQNDSLPDLDFEETTLPVTETSLAGHVASKGQALNIPNAYEPPPGLVFNRAFDGEHGYRTCSMLVLPMLNQQEQVIGVLQLINRKRAGAARLTTANAEAQTQPYSQLEERIVLALASQAAISIERNQLQKSIEDLFEGFIRASVEIIEARDPATAGHSERVADLTVRLAEEVNTVDSGPLRGARFDQDQIQEIRYASLLHDFGKVGVPESVLVKAKKLYPEQLESIRYRFELARRGLELKCARQRLAHVAGHPECLANCGHAQETGDMDHARDQAMLDGFWDLVMRLNEPMILPENQTEEIMARMRLLAAFRYPGISGTDEPLVTDHELKQLLIRKGSLTDAERQAIESHVSQSFRFLSRIPWTAALKSVPDIAHGHHEKLDGTGYPLGLTADRIPMQSQIMTVSDIFDALSAADRPYKKALSTERSLTILREEAGFNHVNLDLVQLFEQRRVYEVLTRR
jgi:HD-GYP domain-containing protein (c-di-GMP phosphodiesterase class II)